MRLKLESLRSKTLLLAVISLTAQSAPCLAQTDPSLRIRSLDVTFAGLLDDFPTDVYLNPARLAGVEGSTVYAALLPPKELQSGLSVKRGSMFDNWAEDFYADFPSIRSVGLGYVGVLGGRLGAALGAEIGHNGSETWNESYWLDQWTGEIRLGQNGWGSSNENCHYLFDLALAPLGSGAAAGVRLSGAYDRRDAGSVSTYRRIGWSTDDPMNSTASNDLYISNRQYERLSVTASAGFFRPEGFLRDVVIGGEYLGESVTGGYDGIDFDTNDADGNGVGPWGAHLDYRYLAYAADSDRDYTGFGGVARAHFVWTERLRSAHAARWTRSTGDGATTDSYGQWFEDSSWQEGVAYTEEGTVDRVQIESSVGFHEKIFDDMLVAFGVHGYFARTAADDGAIGEFSLSQDAVSVFAAPYRQRREGTNDVYRLTIPVAFEWPFHKYLTLRIGASFYALRSEAAWRLSTNLDEMFGGGYLPRGGGFEPQTGERRTEAAGRFNTGLEFHFGDRFVVDMAYWNSSWVELANFGYLSARYRF